MRSGVASAAAAAALPLGLIGLRPACRQAGNTAESHMPAHGEGMRNAGNAVSVLAFWLLDSATRKYTFTLRSLYVASKMQQ